MRKKDIRAVMSAMGSKGGKKAAGAGIRKTNATLTPEERRARAVKAARARWSGNDGAGVIGA